MTEKYFSERERGEIPRDKDDLTAMVVEALVSLIKMKLESGAFGKSFPENCPDGNAVIGTNEGDFYSILNATIPELTWPPIYRYENRDHYPGEKPGLVMPEAKYVMDLIEFCFSNIALPIQTSYHGFFRHHHLSFDIETGKNDFRKLVNQIFSRNGLAFELNENGSVERLSNIILQREIYNFYIRTGDEGLDEYISRAVDKFCKHDPAQRLDGLKELWDAWERIKTVEKSSDKSESMKLLLDKGSMESNFRAVLELEARTLTDIGNKFQIRHSETNKIPLQDIEHVDYLFHRMFCMITLLIKSRSK